MVDHSGGGAQCQYCSCHANLLQLGAQQADRNGAPSKRPTTTTTADTNHSSRVRSLGRAARPASRSAGRHLFSAPAAGRRWRRRFGLQIGQTKSIWRPHSAQMWPAENWANLGKRNDKRKRDSNNNNRRKLAGPQRAGQFRANYSCELPTESRPVRPTRPASRPIALGRPPVVLPVGCPRPVALHRPD